MADGTASGSGRPALGRFQDPSFGAGGSREGSSAWSGATPIASPRTALPKWAAFISQNAILDASGNPLLANNTDYSWRARTRRPPASAPANCASMLSAPPPDKSARASPSQSRKRPCTAYQEFTAQLFCPKTSLPSDLTLRVCGFFTLFSSGYYFLVDNIAPNCPTPRRILSLGRASGTKESRRTYHGVSGIMSIAGKRMAT